ncbi:GIY-YIG nuclease family protein [Streptomyces sp. NPDC005786]|uniref:GIY-YIG nuclease family protein n=1 Tax=Streptomyces sp. NPDC005786 TaxID=3154891 RepID=UPI0033FE991F
MPRPDRTALYRIYDENDALLYVGTTRNLKSRWKQHSEDKLWWQVAHYIDYKWFPSQAHAEAEEQNAIAAECPPHNRQMPPWRLPIPTPLMQAWKDTFNDVAELAFEALTAGANLTAVAEAAEWSPRYIVRLGLQRHVPWAEQYVARIRDGKVRPS